MEIRPKSWNQNLVHPNPARELSNLLAEEPQSDELLRAIACRVPANLTSSRPNLEIEQHRKLTLKT